MKASRMVFTSTIKEYSFIEQRLFIERLIKFEYHLACIAAGCISLVVFFSIYNHDVLEFNVL